MKQRSFCELEYAGKKKRTRREIFLYEMNRLIPWIGIVKMLRMYFVQQFYNLADEALKDAVYDSQALRTFIGIDLPHEPVPDTTTLL